MPRLDIMDLFDPLGAAPFIFSTLAAPFRVGDREIRGGRDDPRQHRGAQAGRGAGIPKPITSIHPRHAAPDPGREVTPRARGSYHDCAELQDGPQSSD